MKALRGFSLGDAVCWNDCQGITLLMFLIVLLFFINCLAPLQSHNESHRFAQTPGAARSGAFQTYADDIIKGQICSVYCE